MFDWMIANYQEVEWYCSYHLVLSFDVWLDQNRRYILLFKQNNFFWYAVNFQGFNTVYCFYQQDFSLISVYVQYVKYKQSVYIQYLKYIRSVFQVLIIMLKYAKNASTFYQLKVCECKDCHLSIQKLLDSYNYKNKRMRSDQNVLFHFTKCSDN